MFWECITFIQNRCIMYIKIDSKDIYNVAKQRFRFQINAIWKSWKNVAQLFPSLIIIRKVSNTYSNTSWALRAGWSTYSSPSFLPAVRVRYRPTAVYPDWCPAAHRRGIPAPHRSHPGAGSTHAPRPRSSFSSNQKHIEVYTTSTWGTRVQNKLFFKQNSVSKIL